MPSPTVKDLYDAMLAVQRAQNMEGNANLNSWFWQFAEAEDFVFADSLGRSFIGKEKVTQHFNYLAQFGQLFCGGLIGEADIRTKAYGSDRHTVDCTVRFLRQKPIAPGLPCSGKYFVFLV